jgi:hypothetical protein
MDLRMSVPKDREVRPEEVFIELMEGRLDLLARYLRETGGVIHGDVAKLIANMVDGQYPSTKYRLCVKTLPGLGPRTPSVLQILARRRQDRLVVEHLIASGANTHGRLKRAIHSAARRFGMSESGIEKIWQGNQALRTELTARRRPIGIGSALPMGPKSAD